MRFKLDENIDGRVAALLRQGGHDVDTVPDERLSGAIDPRIAEVCKAQGRCLITLDVDFANILSYPPQDYPGIVVLRPPSSLFRLQHGLVREVLRHMKSASPAGCLWIVEPGRIRVYEPR